MNHHVKDETLRDVFFEVSLAKEEWLRENSSDASKHWDNGLENAHNLHLKNYQVMISPTERGPAMLYKDQSLGVISHRIAYD